MFSKYRVLYVDYDTNRLSVRLPDEQKFIPAAAAEIEKLMDYAHLLEEGDMEICEPSEISPEEFIEGINRFSAPSMRSYSKFHHPSDGFFSVESPDVPSEFGSLSFEGMDEDADFNEKIADLIEEEPVPGTLTEDLVQDSGELKIDAPPVQEEEVSFDDLDDMDLDLIPESHEEIVGFDETVSGEVPSPDESVSFDDLDDMDLDLLPDSEEAVPEAGENISSEAPVFDEPVSFDNLDDMDLDILSKPEEAVPESGETISSGVSPVEDSISFDDLDEMDLDLLPDSGEDIPEFEELTGVEPDLSPGDGEPDVSLSAGSFPEIEGFEGSIVLEEDDFPDIAAAEIPDSGSLTDIEDEEFPGELSSGFEVNDEFSDLEDLVEESAVDTLLVEAKELVSEGKYEDAMNLLGGSVLEKSGSADLWIMRGDICAMAEHLTDAIESYERALELDPDNMTAVLSLYRLYKESENYYDAAELLDSYIKKNPEDSHLWFEKGWLSEKSGDFGEALMDYDQAISLDAGCTRAVASKALLLMREKRPEEALECYDLLIEIKPGNAAVHHSRGLVLKVMGEYDEAIDSFKEAIRLDPSDSDTLLEVAILLLETGRFKDALGYYNRLIDSGFEGSEVFSGQGDAYLALGMSGEALSSYERAIDAGGNILGALKGRAEILAASGNPAEAVEAYNSVLEINPMDTDVLRKLAALYEDAGHPGQALTAYDRILIADPENSYAISGRIKCLVSLERYSEAIPLYDGLIVTSPGRSDLIAGKAFSLAKTGRKDDAVVLYVSALQLEPENVGYLLELVSILSDLGRYGESLSYYDRLISLVPGESGFVMSRALALYTLGRYEDSVADFEKVLRKKPDDTDALINMGTALFRLGDRRAAMVCYKRSIDFDPSLEEEWLMRGISASSFIEWEIDRIHRISESSIIYGSGDAKPKLRASKMEKEDFTQAGTGSVSSPVMESSEYDSVNIPDTRTPTKEQLDDPDYLYKKGVALARRGYYRASLKCFSRIETLTEDCSDAVFSKGIIYAKNGYFNEALDCFDRVLKMNPSHEKAQKAKRMAEIKRKI
ncbi:tetratricopeptide repeat protein [Methanolacinia petrolearia]|uniref:tetratricopeptide repeat protein n=1 Tax=Methanolacinia petrolearia TaxID=54120 RepID=UPI0011D06C9C|nr:tetratricopeptide repeat protein [Methanolacinia petrolearia]